jgi:hypothetical protein
LLPSGNVYTIAFWISIASVFVVGIYGIVEAIKVI